MKLNSYCDTWVEILLENIHHNFLQFRGYVKEQTKIMAVVKADGYGHGAVEIAKTLMQAEADYLAVALLDEAMQLRNAGTSHPILVLGYSPVRSVQKAVSEDITLTVFSLEVLDEIILAYPVAIQELKEEKYMPEGMQIRQSKYLNNIVEQDHRFIKKRVGSMLGLQSFRPATLI